MNIQERHDMIERCLSEKGRYKNCSLMTRFRVLRARIIWSFVKLLK